MGTGVQVVWDFLCGMHSSRMSILVLEALYESEPLRMRYESLHLCHREQYIRPFSDFNRDILFLLVTSHRRDFDGENRHINAILTPEHPVSFAPSLKRNFHYQTPPKSLEEKREKKKRSECILRTVNFSDRDNKLHAP